MRVKVHRTGESLAVQIPQSLAEQFHIEEGAEVDLSVIGEELIVMPLDRPRYNLDELLAMVRPENIPGEQWQIGGMPVLPPFSLLPFLEMRPDLAFRRPVEQVRLLDAPGPRPPRRG